MMFEPQADASAKRKIVVGRRDGVEFRWHAIPATAESRVLLLAGIFALASTLLIDAGAGFLGAPALHGLLSNWLWRQANNDSWGPMIQAYSWLREPHQGTLYQDLFFLQHLKFQYPPTALLPLAALDALGRPPSTGVFNAGNWLILVLVAVATAALAVALARRTAAIPTASIFPSAAVAAVTGFATIAFYPVIWSYSLGQTQTGIDLAFVLACLCWVGERRLAAGMLIGVICLVKPQCVLFLAWGALRGQRPFLIGWCAVALPGLALSIALFGVANHLDYLSTLHFLSSHGEAFYPNQSVNGLLNRLLHNGDSLNWSATDFPPFHPVVYFGTLLSSAALILAALFWRTRQPDSGGLLDFMTAALTFTIASPIAWEHHYGILPAIFASLVFALLATPAAGRRWSSWAILAAAYVFSANFFPVANLTAAGPLNFLQSYLLLAGLSVLFLLYRVRAPLMASERVAGFGHA